MLHADMNMCSFFVATQAFLFQYRRMVTAPYFPGYDIKASACNFQLREEERIMWRKASMKSSE